MAWPTPGWTAVLVLVPPAAALAVGAWRLAPDGWPRRRVLAVTAVSWLPAAGSILLGLEMLWTWTGPLGVDVVLLLLVGLQALFAALVWGASRPWMREHPGLLVGASGIAALIGLSLARTIAPEGPAGPPGSAGLVPLGLLLAATAPSIAAGFSKHEDRARWAGPAALGVLLLVWSLVAAGFTAIELTAGNAGGPAEYRWGIHAEPNGTGPYTVEVPFPTVRTNASTQTQRAQEVEAALRERVHVAEGEAELTWSDDGSRLRVEADGPVTVRGVYRFYGSIGTREAFGHFHLANATMTRGSGASWNVTVSWTVAFSGGPGHTCWGQGATRVDLAPGEIALIVPERADPSELDQPWQTACA